jgi:hypothetical protein
MFLSPNFVLTGILLKISYVGKYTVNLKNYSIEKVQNLIWGVLQIFGTSKGLSLVDIPTGHV